MRSTATISAARPRYGLFDVVGLLFRELLLMIVIFVVVFAIGAAVVLTMKKTYTASASLFAGVGQEYVYQPRVGQGERSSQTPQAGEIAQAEAAILNSQEVKIRTVRALGVEAFQDKPSTQPMARQEAAAVRTIGAGLEAGAAPLSSVVGVRFESDDPEKAALILNTIIDQYLQYRREVVFQDRRTGAIQAQRQAFEADLAAADAAYENFLRTNDIGDFTTSQATLAASYQATYASMLTVQAQLSQVSQRLTTLMAQQAQTPAEIALQQDLNISAQDQILQLRNEREQLLARYRPDSQPVRDMDARIEQLQIHVASGTAVGVREVRTGPNPIWVEIETTRINAQAERDSLAAQLGVLNRQLDDIRGRQARLTQLESANATLAGDRALLRASVGEFQQRDIENRAASQLIRAGADNVTVIERASPPTRGKSLKAPLLAAVFLFAGFTALCVGLMRIFLRRGLSTPGSARRTLEMPVLAVAPMKAH